MRKQLKQIAFLSSFMLIIFASIGNTQDGRTNYQVCYNKSQVSIGSTYYDCGSCSKVYDEKAKGRPSKCFN